MPPAPNRPIRSVAVFCGSSFGSDPAYADACRDLGTALGRNGVRLVYGGAQVGLMGVVAQAALDAGGRVLGIVPAFLQRQELAHESLTQLLVTETLHARKAAMADAADAFIAMPGGFGTFDELIEIVTWRRLGLHDKPIALCNVAGWADTAVALFQSVVENGFAPAKDRATIGIYPGVTTLLQALGLKAGS